MIIREGKQMKKITRYLGSLLFCNIYRLLRIFPNNDPIMGFTLPFARRDRWWQALIFPILAMVSFDLITMRIGIWTFGTAATYGFIGLVFYAYFKRKKKIGLKTYAKSSIIGVLIFDFFTGPVMSSFAFNIPFAVAFIGQIPFTAMHLAGAVPLTLAIAPVLDPDVMPRVHNSLVRSMHRIKMILSEQFLRF